MHRARRLMFNYLHCRNWTMPPVTQKIMLFKFSFLFWFLRHTLRAYSQSYVKRSFLVGLTGLQWVPGNKPGLDMCKTNTLLTVTTPPDKLSFLGTVHELFLTFKLRSNLWELLGNNVMQWIWTRGKLHALFKKMFVLGARAIVYEQVRAFMFLTRVWSRASHMVS